MKRTDRIIATGCPHGLTRRGFLKVAAAAAAALPAFAHTSTAPAAEARPRNRAGARVAIVPCRTYGQSEVRAAMKQAFDHLGGIGPLVAKKTVTVKINMTGTDFSSTIGHTVGETYMTHYATALALATLLFDAGAKRVRFVESANNREDLEPLLGQAGWNTAALAALGQVEFENTRNLGSGKKYSELKVPGGGLMFSSFQVNHWYDETDVLVSLCKLKQHFSAGVTLSMKNLFGMTPNALYGDEAGSEDATGGRGPFHSPEYRNGPNASRIVLPGYKLTKDNEPDDQGIRIPRIVTDCCGARPIHLAVIDGITTVSGGEGRWFDTMKFVQPGVLIAGLNPVSSDAVGTAVMGFDPRAPRATEPFGNCENHLLLAEQTGLGTADLREIEVLGLPIAKARCPFPALGLK